MACASRPSAPRWPSTSLATTAWALFGALTVTWAVFYLRWPLSKDQGNLVWVGWVITQGGMPYVDAWDVKGPATHLLFAGIVGLFGVNGWGVRTFDLVMLAVGTFAVYRLAHLHADRFGARLASLLFVAWHASLAFGETAQPDAWAGALLAAAMLLLAHPHARVASWATAAALIGVCALMKPTFIPLLLLPIVCVLASARGGIVTRLFGPLLIVALSGFVPAIACYAWIRAGGAWSAMKEVQIEWIPEVYAAGWQAGWSWRIEDGILRLTSGRLAVTVAVAQTAVVCLWHERRLEALLLSAWWGTLFLGVIAQGKFFEYHWFPLHAPTAVLAGIGAARMRVWLQRNPPRDTRDASGSGTSSGVTAGAYALAVVVITPALLPMSMHVVRETTAFLGLRDRMTYERSAFGAYGQHDVFQQVAQYVQRHSSPSESLLVWGDLAGINVMSHRPAASRFGFVDALVRFPDDAYRRRYRAEFLAHVRRTAPRFVLALDPAVCDDPVARQRNDLQIALMHCLSDFASLNDFVQADYRIDARVGSLVLWSRRVAGRGI